MRNLSENKIFTFLLFLLFLTIIVKLWVLLNENIIVWQNFLSIYLWKCFYISTVGYSLILFLSILYAKLFKVLSTPFIFIASYFLLYFFTQINLVSPVLISEAGILRTLLVLWTLIIVYKLFVKKEKVAFQRYKTDVFSLLVILWIVLTGLYFLGYNFSLNREIFADEKFWIGQANIMTNIPIYERMLNNLIDPNLYAISFIAALPNILLGTHLEGSFFFMSIVVIAGIVLFLNLIKRDRWCFLFFFLALIMTLNRHLWLRKLHFGLIYGEGIICVFFLLAIYELMKIKEKNISFYHLLLLSFWLGFFAFTKHPMNYVFLSFIPILLFVKPIKLRNKIILLMTFIFPIIIRHLIMIYRSCDTIYSGYIHGIGSLFQYDFSQIKPMVIYLIDGYTMPIFFSSLSIVFISLTFRGKDFLYIIPIICLVGFIFYLYITIFSDVEYESSARYLSQGMLPLFYLGAIGFRRFIHRVFKETAFSIT